MVHEAIAKKHSTTGEAIDVGMRMGAHRVLLTHFSQRYPKIPVFDRSFTDVTCIAFDMTIVDMVRDLPHLPKLLKPVQEVFAEELKEVMQE